MRVLPHEALNTLITSSQAAQLAGVTVEAVCNWKNRGHITPAGLDDKGRPMYRLGDIIKVERKTRNRQRN